MEGCHEHCLALAPNWKCWKHRTSGNRLCTQHFPSCTFLQIRQLCTGCSLCLGCCSLLHLPGDLLVVLLVPAETPLTLRCPFKFPRAGEVTYPPLPGFPQPLAQPLGPPHHTVLSLSTGKGLCDHAVKCVGTGTTCPSSLWSCPAHSGWGSANPSRVNE